MQSSNYQILIQKVDEFIRKYYLNNLIRGTLHTVAVLVVAVISFALLEHYIFNSSVSSMSLRKGLLYSFAGLSGLALAYWVIVPLVQYLKLGKIISHTQAADIIGNHFSTVKDKLLNVLQLKQQNDQQENLLITASIDQKIQELRPVPFKAAIDLTENRKYLRFALPPLFLLLGLLLFSNIIENSASRIIQNDKEFERDALFRFKLKVENPSIVQYENYELVVDVDGEALPQEVFILMDNSRYKLEKVNNTTFKYQFTKLQKDTDFRLTANDVTSKKYTIDVLEKPSIVNFDIKVKYPSYTGRTPEVLSNVGDLTLPVGTQLEWAFQTQHTNDIQLQFGESPREAAVSSDANNYTFSKKVDKDGSYKIIVANKNLPQGDSVAYMLSVIPDMYPSISVKKFQDSLNKKIVFFAGDASDDYGIRNLNFHYEISREGKTVEQKSLPLLTAKGKQTTYEYTLDVNTLPLKPGDKLSYYFQVFDNDGANGSKSSKTELMYFESPTVEAMKAAENQNNKEIKTDIDKAINELEMLQNNIKKAQNAMLQTDEMNWQNKKELQNLIEQQKQVEQKMRQAKANFEENLKTQEEAGQKVDSATLEKQEILEKLFEEVMNDEMKKMFEDLEKMLDKMDKNQLMEKLNDIKMSDEEMKKELDRMLELFKKLEVEKELNETISQLDSLAEKQTDLSKETEKLDQKPNPSAQEQDKMKEAQDKLNKEFDKLKEDLDKTLDKNKALEEKVEMPEKDLQQKANEVKEDQKSGKENLDKKQNKDASKKQKNAGEKMKEMAKDMKSAMGKDKKQKNEENLKSLQQLLENLVGMSMEQENLAAEIDKAQTTAPNYVKLVQRQYKLKDDFRHVEDSLQALAKRVFELKSFVTEKVTDAKKSISKSLFYLEDRQKRPATVQQQTTMTTLNDLALMLAESMKKMNNDMAGDMDGDQNCEKPGNNPGGDNPGEGKPGKKGKPGKGGKMGDLRQMQEALQRQLQQMEQMMKDGKMPGGEQSKQFAQMAAKQAAIRKQLQQMKKEKQQQGKGGQELQNLIDQMDKTETELVNKRLPNDMQKRQQDIVTRLLEAENSEREREYEEKRKAEQADVVEQKMPPAMQEYLRQRQSQVDMFKTVSPSLKPYYKNLVEQYFNSLK